MSEDRARRASTYPLRLPASIKREAERLAAEDGSSLNQFVASAVAEKVDAMRTAAFFEERRARGLGGVRSAHGAGGRRAATRGR